MSGVKITYSSSERNELIHFGISISKFVFLCQNVTESIIARGLSSNQFFSTSFCDIIYESKLKTKKNVTVSLRLVNYLYFKDDF